MFLPLLLILIPQYFCCCYSVIFLFTAQFRTAASIPSLRCLHVPYQASSDVLLLLPPLLPLLLLLLFLPSILFHENISASTASTISSLLLSMLLLRHNHQRFVLLPSPRRPYVLDLRSSYGTISHGCFPSVAAMPARTEPVQMCCS